MSLTAFFVTRDHGPYLGRAIRSLAGLAGAVIVADTGSTDNTIAVAEEHGARAIPIRWADDFAAACNEAVAAATGEWLLWINPDEELEPAGLAALGTAMADAKVFAWHLKVRQLHTPDDAGTGPPGWQLRLFRRDSSLHFLGRLHPAFTPPIEEIAARRHLAIGMSDAVLRRHAYLSQPTPDKMRWVVRLLEAELQDRPGQLGYQIELGRNLLWLNDPRGHVVLAEAAEQIRGLADRPASPSPWVGSLIEYLLSVSAEQSRSSVTRAEARALALRWFPDAPPVLWSVAGERFAARDFAAASTHLERLLHLGRTGTFDDGGGFAPDILGHASLLNLGICYLHVERWDDARKCFVEVVDDPVRRDSALHGLRLAERKRRPS